MRSWSPTNEARAQNNNVTFGSTRVRLEADVHKKYYAKHFLGVFAGLLVGLVANSPVRASTLNLTQTYPDLEVWNLPIGYSFDTQSKLGTFTANASYGGLTITTVGGLVGSSPTGGSADSYDYSLSATLDGNGSLVSGSLGISDHMTGASMLTASLTDFGATHKTGGDVFEFTGDQVSGELAKQFPAFKSGLGVIMNTAGYDSSFTGSFTGGFTATALVDNFPHPVPIPAAAWLFGSGLIGLVGVSRGNRRRQ